MPDEVTPPIDSSMDGSPDYQAQGDAQPQPQQPAQAPPPQTQQDPLTDTIPQQQAPATPQNDTRSQTPSGGGLFETVLQALAGNPQKSGAHYDPNTGQLISQPVTSKGSLAAHIVAGALTGALRGMAAPPGPGHATAGGALALQGGIADQQRQQQTMQADYERQQQAQVQKYQIAHLNAQTALDSANAASAGMDTLKKVSQ
jgi:hypothetical protein